MTRECGVSSMPIRSPVARRRRIYSVLLLCVVLLMLSAPLVAAQDGEEVTNQNFYWKVRRGYTMQFLLTDTGVVARHPTRGVFNVIITELGPVPNGLQSFSALYGPMVDIAWDNGSSLPMPYVAMISPHPAVPFGNWQAMGVLIQTWLDGLDVDSSTLINDLRSIGWAVTYTTDNGWQWMVSTAWYKADGSLAFISATAADPGGPSYSLLIERVNVAGMGATPETYYLISLVLGCFLSSLVGVVGMRAAGGDEDAEIGACCLSFTTAFFPGPLLYWLWLAPASGGIPNILGVELFWLYAILAGLPFISWIIAFAISSEASSVDDLTDVAYLVFLLVVLGIVALVHFDPLPSTVVFFTSMGYGGFETDVVLGLVALEVLVVIWGAFAGFKGPPATVFIFSIGTQVCVLLRLFDSLLVALFAIPLVLIISGAIGAAVQGMEFTGRLVKMVVATCGYLVVLLLSAYFNTLPVSPAWWGSAFSQDLVSALLTVAPVVAGLVFALAWALDAVSFVGIAGAVSDAVDRYHSWQEERAEEKRMEEERRRREEEARLEAERQEQLRKEKEMYPWRFAKGLPEGEPDAPERIVAWVTMEEARGADLLKERKHDEALKVFVTLKEHILKQESRLAILGRDSLEELKARIDRHIYMTKADALIEQLQEVHDRLQALADMGTMETPVPARRPKKRKKKGKKKLAGRLHVSIEELVEEEVSGAMEMTPDEYQARVEELLENASSIATEAKAVCGAGGFETLQTRCERLEFQVQQLATKARELLDKQRSLLAALGERADALKTALEMASDGSLSIKGRIERLTSARDALLEALKGIVLGSGDIYDAQQLLEKADTELDRLDELKKLQETAIDISEVKDERDARDSVEALLWKLEKQLEELDALPADSDQYWALYEKMQNSALRAEAIARKFGLDDLMPRVHRFMDRLGRQE